MYKFYNKIFVQPPGYIKQLLLAMKLTALLLTIGILQVSAATYAQKVTLKDKNTSLKEVFNQIRQQSGYDFIITSDLLSQAKPVTIEVSNTDLRDVLDKIFDDQPLNYTIQEKTVIITKKDESFLDKLRDKIKADLAQVTVTGKVTNELGEPMVGVTVKQKTNPANGVVTDAKGNYRIIVPDDKTIIVFSYIGYETQEIPAKDLPDGSVIVLKAAENNLREVVISKGYYDEKRELSTGSVSVVSSKAFEEQPVSDPILDLEARVPGLYIQQTSGAPGSYATILLRGQNSIANGNAPLYIIDGVPFGSTTLTNNFLSGGILGSPTGTAQQNGSGMSPFNALNPEDIESIEVLKDADATSIYGSRGANGVILITTKRGKAGDTRISFDISQGIGNVAHTMNLMNTQQYLQTRHQALANDGLTPDPTYDFDLTDWDTTRYTNWQKVLIGNTAHYTNSQLSVSGGTEATQFYIGSGFTRQTTVFPGDYDDEKGSLNFNLTHSSANKRFQLQFSGGFVYDNSDLPNYDLTYQALKLAPDAPAIYNADGSLNWQPVGGTATWQNPLAYILAKATAETKNLTSNLLLSYQILPGLLLKSTFGYNDIAMNQSTQTPASFYAPPTNNDPNYRVNDFANNENSTWIIEPQLSYSKKVSKGNLNVLIGTSFQRSNSFEMAEFASGFANDELINNPLNASTLQLKDYNNTEYRYAAIYGRINYSWEDKYLLNITARRDGSSRFGQDNLFGNFGAIGAGWIFSKERFVADNLPWLSFGKLRGSYGTTGNDQIGDYQYLSAYTIDSRTYQNSSGLYPTRLANPNYGWEIDHKLEAGLDMGFLKDRINLTVDYYRNRSNNQLVGYPLSSITGFESVQYNLPAVVQNTGLEFTANTINVKSSSFQWSSSFNLTIPRNKLVSYPDIAASSYANRYVVGQSLFIQKVYNVVGVDPATGVYQYASQNGPTSSPSYPTDLVVRPVTQQFFGGFENTLSYKGFQLDMLLQFVKQTAYNYGGFEGNLGRFNNNMPAILVNAWKAPGNVTRYGEASTENASDPNYLISQSTFAIGDASFIRLKNVQLSYNIPQSIAKTLFLKKLRVYIQAENLLTFTNYFGLDPETQGVGLPPLRTIAAGIHSEF